MTVTLVLNISELTLKEVSAARIKTDFGGWEEQLPASLSVCQHLKFSVAWSLRFHREPVSVERRRYQLSESCWVFHKLDESLCQRICIFQHFQSDRPKGSIYTHTHLHTHSHSLIKTVWAWRRREEESELWAAAEWDVSSFLYGKLLSLSEHQEHLSLSKV